MEDELQRLIENYKVPDEAIELVKTTPIVLLVGVSGAGKDTIKQKLLASGKYHHIISHTTRAPRENNGEMEKDGVSYHFITKDQAAIMLKNGEFIEAKQYSGNIYGTSVAEIRRANEDGKIAVTDLEVQGVAEYKTVSENVIAMFVLPPNYDEWQRRLLARYGNQTVNSEDIERRKKTAVAELKEALDKPYYHFVVNEDLDVAANAVDKIAERHGEFTTVDKSFKVWAERLLEELQAGV